MIEKITEEEIRSLGVSSLPRSPSAPSLYGGRSMDSVALRAAFDRLPVCIARKVNAIIDGLGLAGEEGERVAALLATGLFEGHSLEDLFGDIRSGRLSAYLTFEDGETLADKAVRWKALHGEAVKRLTRGSLLYATDEGGATVGLAYGEETLPHTVPLRGKDGALLDVALHDASGDAHADLRERLTEVEREVTLRARARVFDTWEDALVFCTAFDREAARATLSVGDRILIRDGSVPDGWVSGFAEVAEPYPGGLGISDPFGDSVAITVGFMILSPLECPKVDLSGLATKEETERALAELQSSVISERAEADEVSRLKAEVSNLRAALAPEYFEADNSAAYVKLVPPFALPFAEVREVGGMSYVADGALRSAEVTALETVGVNILDISAALNSVLVENGDGTYTITRVNSGNRFSATLPFYLPPNSEIRTYCEIVKTNIEGFSGSVPIQILDADGKTEIGAAGLDNGGQSYSVKNGSYFIRFYLNTLAPIGGYVTFRNPMIKYDSSSAPYAPYVKRTYPIPDGVQALEGWGLGVDEAHHNRLVWNVAEGVKQYRREVGLRAYESGDESRADAVTDGQRTVYVLNTPEITDLSDVLSDDNFIRVEEGGIVTAVNAHGLAVPTKIEYQVKEVTA